MKSGKTNLRLKLQASVLMLIALSIFMAVSCSSNQKEEAAGKTVSVVPTKMNVLYIGVDNPVQIHVSGYEQEDITLKIDEELGKVKAVGGGSFIVNPMHTGNLTLVVMAEEDSVYAATFRVKSVPDPVAMINKQSGGEIKKEALLEQNKVVAGIPNFDFNVDFKVVEFAISSDDKRNPIQSAAMSNQITDEQKTLIKNTKPGSMVYIEEIVAIGPDGSKRKLPTLVFKILE